MSHLAPLNHRRGVLSTKQILQQARELLSDTKRWTKGAFRRDASDNTVCITRHNPNPAVCSWDIIGAIREVGGYEDEASAALDLLPERLGEFNDQKSHQAVLGLLDRTIAGLT